MATEKSSTKKSLPLSKQGITELLKRADALFDALHNPKEHTTQDLKRYEESLYNHFIPEIKKREISVGQRLYDQIDKEKSQAKRLNKQINSDTILDKTQKLFELQNKVVDKLHEYEIKKPKIEYVSQSTKNKEKYEIAQTELMRKHKKYKKKLKKTWKIASLTQEELNKVQDEIVDGFAVLLGNEKFLKSIKNILKQKSKKEGDYLVAFNKSGKVEIPKTVFRVANMLRQTASNTIKDLLLKDTAKSTVNDNVKFISAIKKMIKYQQEDNPEFWRKFISNDNIWNGISGILEDKKSGIRVDRVFGNLMGTALFKEGGALDEEGSKLLADFIVSDKDKIRQLLLDGLEIAQVSKDSPKQAQKLVLKKDLVGRAIDLIDKPDSSAKAFFQNRSQMLVDNFVDTIYSVSDKSEGLSSLKQLKKTRKEAKKILGDLGLTPKGVKQLGGIVPILLKADKITEFKTIYEYVKNGNITQMGEKIIDLIDSTSGLKEYLRDNQEIMTNLANNIFNKIPKLKGLEIKKDLLEIAPKLLEHPEELKAMLKAANEKDVNKLTENLVAFINKTEVSKYINDNGQDAAAIALKVFTLDKKIDPRVVKIFANITTPDNLEQIQEIIHGITKNDASMLDKAKSAGKMFTLLREDTKIQNYFKQHKKDLEQITDVVFSQVPGMSKHLGNSRLGKVVAELIDGVIQIDPDKALQFTNSKKGKHWTGKLADFSESVGHVASKVFNQDVLDETVSAVTKYFSPTLKKDKQHLANNVITHTSKNKSLKTSDKKAKIKLSDAISQLVEPKKVQDAQALLNAQKLLESNKKPEDKTIEKNIIDAMKSSIVKPQEQQQKPKEVIAAQELLQMNRDVRSSLKNNTVKKHVNFLSTLSPANVDKIKLDFENRLHDEKEIVIKNRTLKIEELEQAIEIHEKQKTIKELGGEQAIKEARNITDEYEINQEQKLEKQKSLESAQKLVDSALQKNPKALEKASEIITKNQTNFNELTGKSEYQDDLKYLAQNNKLFEYGSVEGTKESPIQLNNLEIDGTNFRKAKLDHVSFANSKIIGADFSGAKLSNINLKGAEIDGKTFATMVDQLRGTDISLDGVKITGTVPSGTDLKNIDFKGTDLSKLKSLKGVDLKDVNFTSAQFKTNQNVLLEAYNSKDAKISLEVENKLTDKEQNVINDVADKIYPSKDSEKLKEQLKSVYNADSKMGEYLRKNLGSQISDIKNTDLTKSDQGVYLFSDLDKTKNLIYMMHRNRDKPEDFKKYLASHIFAKSIEEEINKDNANLTNCYKIQQSILGAIYEHDINVEELLAPDKFEQTKDLLTKVIKSHSDKVTLGFISSNINSFSTNDKDSAIAKEISEAAKQSVKLNSESYDFARRVANEVMEDDKFSHEKLTNKQKAEYEKKILISVINTFEAKDVDITDLDSAKNIELQQQFINEIQQKTTVDVKIEAVRGWFGWGQAVEQPISAEIITDGKSIENNLSNIIKESGIRHMTVNTSTELPTQQDNREGASQQENNDDNAKNDVANISPTLQKQIEQAMSKVTIKAEENFNNTLETPNQNISIDQSSTQDNNKEPQMPAGVKNIKNKLQKHTKPLDPHLSQKEKKDANKKPKEQKFSPRRSIRWSR